MNIKYKNFIRIENYFPLNRSALTGIKTYTCWSRHELLRLGRGGKWNLQLPPGWGGGWTLALHFPWKRFKHQTSKADGNAYTADWIRAQCCGAQWKCLDRARPCAVLAFQETKSTASMTSARNLHTAQGKVELEHPGGILFAVLSSEKERTNSAAAQWWLMKQTWARKPPAIQRWAGRPSAPSSCSEADTGALLHLEK